MKSESDSESSRMFNIELTTATIADIRKFLNLERWNAERELVNEQSELKYLSMVGSHRSNQDEQIA